MTTTAIIDAAGFVQNIILAHHADVDPQALGHPEGWQAVDGEGGAIGDTWDGLQFLRPPVPEAEPPVPDSITRAQGKAALIYADLMPAVTAFIASIADPKDRALAEVTMNDEDAWRRDNAFLNAAGAAMGLTAEQIDDLFRQASLL